MSHGQQLPLAKCPKRRWLQFSLRTLLLAMLVLGVGLGWFAERVRRQREALSKIIRYGGQVTYDYQLDASGNFRRDQFGNYLHGLQPPGPKWLRQLLGDDYFQSPVTIWLESDEGVGFLDSELQVLAEPIQSLHELKSLSLCGSPITDAGLTHLRGMTQLKQLDCRGTKVTDRGIESLQKDLPHCRIRR
ncbi:MAG: hypothetical protein WEH44_07745 [Pirellulaceae bacterium]